MDNPLFEESIESTEEALELEQPTVNATEEMEGAESVTAESQESEAEGESSEAEGGNQELLSLDGEEVDLDTVRKWKSGHLMQEDYTRKTQALAEERKQAKTKVEELDAVVSSLEAELLSEISDQELADLRDYDPSAYLKRKEQMDDRRQKLAAFRSKAAQARDELDNKIASEERQHLLKANPDWLDAVGQPTEKYQKDVNMMNAYLASNGWSTDEVAQIGTAKMWGIIKEAAELKAAISNNSGLKKKVSKAPTVTKPQSTHAAPPKSRTVGTMLYGD